MSWGAGYVTDIAYAPGYYVEQSPRLMALAALVNGFAAAIPGRNERFHFVDIGCGLGFSALVLAATNPGWTVTGLDFNPAHIARARAMATRAGIANCQFIEADFTRFTCTELPDFDAASLHGVWTWVSAPVQQGIVRLLAEKLKPGGLCHVSYNVLPAWRGVIGLQRLMREAGSRLAFRADRQAAQGFAVVRRLMEAGSGAIDPSARRILDHCADKPAAYLAHEFMNQAWAPCFHHDVAAALAGAKLTYAGSPHLLENFPALALDDTARAIAAGFEDPSMIELLKDVTANQPLRHDIFVRGATSLDPMTRDATLCAVPIGLAVPYATRRLTFESAAGQATMNAGLYEPAFARLAEGPTTIGDLLAIARASHPDDSQGNPAELLAMLIGTGQAVMVPDAAARMDPATVRLNAAMFTEKMQGSSVMNPVALAVPALGGGIALPGLAAFAVLRQHDWLSEATIGQALPRPDDAVFAAWAAVAAPAADEAIVAQMKSAFADFFEHQAAMLNRLGLPC
ncbi:class I SAM-dependent methyltransferase [Acidiphilium sp. PA]|uniref:class I SAM-dependent methyltransferase n=1 Tax=Acidiphilium sp. PA TaxID=2871705 RepID=UPI0022447F6C|nr:class I SAM-dependent methyltransferase [Acidiphilium sp. PA]MCW8307709.1 class I SAM-dependent methyltransferase [Acidiphilium sp. PA]